MAVAALLPLMAARTNGHARTATTAMHAACTPSADTTATPQPHESDSLAFEERRRYDYFFLEALAQRGAGHDKEARELLEYCLTLRPDAAEACFLLSKIISDNDPADSTAFAYMLKAATLQPSNDTYQEQLADTYIAQGRYKEAADTYERLYAHHKDRTYVLETLLRLYSELGRYDDLLGVVERMEQAEGSSNSLSVMKYQVYEMIGDKENAYNTLLTLANENPYDAEYKTRLGNWLLLNGRNEEAKAFLTAAVAEDSDNDFALESLYDFYRSEQDSLMTDSLTHLMLTSESVSVETKTRLLKTLMQQYEDNHADSTLMLSIFDKTIREERDYATIVNLKSIYMMVKGMPRDSVIASFRHSLALCPENDAVRIATLEMMTEDTGYLPLMQKTCLEGIDLSPGQPYYYFALAISLHMQGKTDEAIATLQQGTANATAAGNEEMLSNMYGLLGDLLSRNRDKTAAIEAYEQALSLSPDNASVLNNYAYLLAAINVNIDKATDMSRRSLDMQPNNVSFLDTYAYLMVLNGNYTEARLYIDKALQQPGEAEADICERAGDIHALCGDTAKARECWQKAIEAGGDAKSLNKKIKNGKIKPPKPARK